MGGGSCFFWISCAWPKPHKAHFLVWCGGGCDGVVVWELYSGREHLVKQDENMLVILWVAGCFCFVLHKQFLMNY